MSVFDSGFGLEPFVGDGSLLKSFRVTGDGFGFGFLFVCFVRAWLWFSNFTHNLVNLFEELKNMSF